MEGKSCNKNTDTIKWTSWQERKGRKNRTEDLSEKNRTEDLREKMDEMNAFKWEAEVNA